MKFDLNENYGYIYLFFHCTTGLVDLFAHLFP